MKCLDCGEKLRFYDPNSETYLCSCGLIYSKELVINIDASKWEFIRTTRFFERVGGRNGTLQLFTIGSENVHPEVYKLHQKYLESYIKKEGVD